jgi:hypothetical protein
LKITKKFSSCKTSAETAKKRGYKIHEKRLKLKPSGNLLRPLWGGSIRVIINKLEEIQEILCMIANDTRIKINVGNLYQTLVE